MSFVSIVIAILGVVVAVLIAVLLLIAYMLGSLVKVLIEDGPFFSFNFLRPLLPQQLPKKKIPRAVVHSFVLAVLLLILFLLLHARASAGVLDFSHDMNKSGAEVTTLVLAGEPAKSVSAIFVGDNTGYGETFMGAPFTLGSLTVIPHVGVEWFRGGGPKGRGIVLTSFVVGRFRFDNVNEFGGLTGNFHKTTVGYSVSEKWKMSLVHHSVARAGMRLDVTPWRSGPLFYIQVLERRTTGGITLVF